MSEGARAQPEMTPERWYQIRDLLADAIRLPLEDRTKYVAKVCGGDSAMRAELESLIAAHDIAEGGVLDKPALDITAGLAMPMGDWNRIRELFETAQHLSPSQRGAFLAQNCADEQTRAQVETLLSNYEAAGNSLDDPAFSHVSEAHTAEIEDPMAGRRLGAYKLVKRIGQGGMAAVFLAVRADDAYQREVAIKLVQPGLDSRELLNRFRNERQTLAGLDHPKIVKLLDGGSTPEGLPFLVMDYVEGTPIDGYCDRLKLSIEERLHLFSRICEAVQYAHQKGVLHRDLKPSNMLVTAEGTPKLLDFGIAKVLEPTAGAPLVTQTGTRCMTPAYASPEQVRGKAVTRATDIYSLGVVLYELLTGHCPYRLKEHTPAEMERAICEQEPETPSTAVSRVESETSPDGSLVTRTPELVSQTREGRPEKLRRRLRGDLDNILLKALCKEPEGRYGSVQEFEGDIDRHLKRLPITARPSSLGRRASKFVQRHKAAVSTFILGIFVLAAAAGIFTLNAFRVRERIAGGTPTPRIQSLAVLPFANLSGDPAQEYFSDGMTGTLITEFSQISTLKVISSRSTMRYKKTSGPLPKIARELNVDGIIDGTVQRIGDRVRITAQLIHEPSGKGQWTGSYERDMRDLPALEREITQEIARQVQAQLTMQNQAQPQPVNLVALEAYLQGNFHLENGSGDDEMRKAQRYFQQAIDADPNFAPGYVGMAEAHYGLFHSSTEDRAIARTSAEKAVLLDPFSSEARNLLAEMKFADWDWPGAEDNSRQAIALNPNDASAHDRLCELLDLKGSLDEGWKECQAAQALDPNNDHLSFALENRGEYARAIELFQRDVQSHPDSAALHYFLFRDYDLSGRPEESIRELEHCLTLNGLPEIAARVHRAFTTSGYLGAMRELAKAFEQLNASGHLYLPRVFAEVYARLGDKDRAFYWLEQGYEHRDRVGGYGSITDMKLEHELDPLHSDPRFKDLVRRVGLPP